MDSTNADDQGVPGPVGTGFVVTVVCLALAGAVGSVVAQALIGLSAISCDHAGYEPDPQCHDPSGLALAMPWIGWVAALLVTVGGLAARRRSPQAHVVGVVLAGLLWTVLVLVGFAGAARP